MSAPDDAAPRRSRPVRAPGAGPADPPSRPDVDSAILRALLTQSPLGLQVLDSDLRVMRINTAGPGLRGLLNEEVLGRPAREVAPGLVDDALEQMMRDVLDTGVPVLDMEHTGRPPADPDHEHTYSVSLVRLQDASGVLGLMVASTDVSERRRARAGLDLLLDAGTRIGTTLDVMTTCGELARAVVPDLADIAVVDVLDDVLLGQAPPPGPVSAVAPLRRAAFESIEGALASVAYRVGELNLTYPRSFRDCLTSLRPRLVQRLEIDSEWGAADPRRAELIRRTRAHSLVVVPLTARGVVLGLASFYRTVPAEPFDEDSLALATEVCARAAVCIDNARRYTRERSAALILQSSLLPQTLPLQSAVEVVHRHVSATAAGDWYDVIPLSGGRVALAVGHVPGSGMHTAAAMGRLRTAINTLAAQDLAPDELLAALDDLVTGPADGGAPTSGTHPTGEQAVGATCVYAVYDPISRRCTLASAGHPAPVIAWPDREAYVPDLPVGPPLGSGRPPYRTTEVELPEGSIIALFTRNLITPESGPPDGLTWLRGALSVRHPTLHDTCDAVIRARPPASADEDVVLVLARTCTLDPDHVASWTLPNDPSVVSTARARSSSQLDAWGLPELDYTTQLVVSELVTNAIRYATGPIELRLIRDRTLICEVTDGSSTAPHLRHADLADEGGRGLFLIAQLTRRWGTRFADRGKTIWAEQALS
ncbi:SpoIIE family protein phosphatase [Streptacidiphilus anmyonensis]|uniref:SpoIIE family protein phosphatase n=1 Tax=Streptacidiphilus anmyonensis TaxID=405782 RepID=UPI000693C9C3|nr:SpoIIE family protein phosphatase [Streptacidiphilus anmyonensis]